MATLDRKVLRDVWSHRGQAVAIAAVIGSGVATLIMSLSTVHSLHLSREVFYRSHRFADAFAALERAPDAVAARLAEVPGVVRVETRVLAPVNLEVPGFGEPITGQLLSLPVDGEGGLDLPVVLRGRAVDPTRSDEVLLSDGFAAYHHLEPGMSLQAIVNGHRERLRIVGVGLSPDYVLQMAPGGVFPDFSRFAILWMDRRALSVAYDMEGAFNRAAFQLAPGAHLEDVLDRIDRVLARYGGLDAHGREHQQSHRYLSEEFRQLGRMSRIFPSIFLSVAMFLLNVVVGRLVQTQRDQIAALKAFGYSNVQVGIHYLKIVLLIAVLGALLGLLLGGWMGRGLTDMYMMYYHFPTPRYEVEPALAAAGVFISCGTAALGTVLAVRRAALLPPAEAMRPEPPARYKVSFIERVGLRRWLGQPSRMILRNLARRPVRTAMSTAGIAASCAILMVSSFFWDSIQHVMHVQFQLVQQEDIAVTFLEPTSGRARHELAALPGVRRAESYRAAPVRLVNGQRSYRTGILGLEPGARLHRVLDDALAPCEIPEAGLVLTAFLAREILDVREGDEVTIEVLELDHPVRRAKVVRLVEEYIGVSGYMSLPALNRLLGEGDAISGAHLAVEPGAEPRVFAALDERPRVAGALSRKGATEAFRKTMAEQMLTFAFFNTILASSIALGVVYNAARIALAERGRELASLRVLGFTRGEVSWILLGELGLLTVCAIPLGFGIGLGLCWLLAQTWQIDLFRLPFAIEPRTFAFAASVVLLSAAGSGLLVRRQLDKLDLVGVLKTRE